MHNKKIMGGAVALAATVVLVGGTLAWFTDSETILNSFNTGKVDIAIEETFDEPADWTPGTTTNKDVEIKNQGKSDAFIRVKLEKAWYDGATKTELSTDNIEVTLVNINTTPTDGSWVYNNADGYYYYIGVVAPDANTNQLVDEVKFVPGNNDNDYAGKKADVNVIAEAIQITNDAYKDAWKSVPQNIQNALDSLISE